MLLLLFLVFTFVAHLAHAFQGPVFKMEGFHPKFFKIHAPGEPMTLEAPTPYFNKNTSLSVGFGACNIPIDERDWVVAVSPNDFFVPRYISSSNKCNECIQIRSEDKIFYARIVELCSTCKNGELALSPEVYKSVAGKGIIIPVVSWDLAADGQCPLAKLPVFDKNKGAGNRYPTLELPPNFDPVQPLPPPPGAFNPIISVISGSPSIYYSCLLSLALSAMLCCVSLFV